VQDSRAIAIEIGKGLAKSVAKPGIRYGGLFPSQFNVVNLYYKISLFILFFNIEKIKN